MANSVGPDETSRSAASHLGLHCLLRPVCPNTYGRYGIFLQNERICLQGQKCAKHADRPLPSFFMMYFVSLKLTFNLRPNMDYCEGHNLAKCFNGNMEKYLDS